LAALVETGRFRRDLYYRLNVIELRMPSIRECKEDVRIIAETMLERLARQNGSDASRLSDRALQELESYDFPGNVRELENILERAVALSNGGQINPDDLRLHPLLDKDESEHAQVSLSGNVPMAQGASLDSPLPAYLDRVEREAILAALAKTRFNRTAAAKLLGVTFRTLRYRMQRLGINEPEQDER
jgi:two-component system response regulator PilR (NtrC family)